MNQNELEVRNDEILTNALNQADTLLMKRYLSALDQYQVVPISPEQKDTPVTQTARLFQIERIVYDNDENNQEKLLNIYSALYSQHSSVVLLVQSDAIGVDFYIGTKGSSPSASQAILEKAIQGNYPGSALKVVKNEGLLSLLDQVFQSEYQQAKKYVTATSGIASFRNDKEQENIGFVQGIEKMIDALRGEKYTMMVVADPVAPGQIDVIRSGYEELYTRIAPFASTELSFSKNESHSVATTLTNGISHSVSQSLSKTETHTDTHSTNFSATKQFSRNSGVSIIVANAGSSSGYTENNGFSDSSANGKSTGITEGRSDGKNKSEAKADTLQDGSSQTLQVSIENKGVRVLLDKIDRQLERMDICNNLGMWSCSGYFISSDMQTSRGIASTYQALIRGENSGFENSGITTWTEDDKLSAVTEYLKKLSHPQIEISSQYPLVTPASLISGDELTIAAGLPQKSVAGVAVYHYTAFGREISEKNSPSERTIKLGQIHHMGMDESSKVLLRCESLSSHVFVTGSTGSGKSNAIYTCLQELQRTNIPFLVIEPAKGEYKHVFSHNATVSVWGTNPTQTPLLKLNPFRFPKGIHVLEHIDRLVEIFNVCWPMYAAMPAVLKDAIVRAYEVSGWDLETSTNAYHPDFFPSFLDLLEQLELVINDSAFSAEVKGNYIGALVTRVKSLTNGINGQIFSSDEIGDRTLFDQSAIVDLSRVASNETTSLIMGILVMRLQEYRMSQGGINLPLKHVTVLEEAHNILKRTSTDQSAEGSNMIGKSVEMISNAIAEMRTYGEGFIIADQSPAMVDMAAIRNTNTKVILRLPDMTDRELVGKSAGLNNNQIEELAKLTTGVAAVYQNNWIDPVLCHISKFQPPIHGYQYAPVARRSKSNILKSSLIRCLLAPYVGDSVHIYREDFIERIVAAQLSTACKLSLIYWFSHSHSIDAKDISNVAPLIAQLLDCGGRLWVSGHGLSVEAWNDTLAKRVGLADLALEKKYQDVALQCLFKEKSKENPEWSDLYLRWVTYMQRKDGST